jgi:hypothetical protein
MSQKMFKILKPGIITFIRGMDSLTKNWYRINKIRIVLQFSIKICGLMNKKEELLNSLTSNSTQIICVTEHHLTDEQLEGTTTLHSCTLGVKFCRQTHKCGGVCEYVCSA